MKVSRANVHSTKFNRIANENIERPIDKSLQQDDWDAYSGLVEELGKTVQIVGDDLRGNLAVSFSFASSTLLSSQ